MKRAVIILRYLNKRRDIMEKQYCDQCENKCPIDALSCGKGRRNFGMEPAESGKESHGRKMPDGVIGLLMQCGHVLHHGGADDEDLLRALNLQEQAELERMLKVFCWTTGKCECLLAGPNTSIVVGRKQLLEHRQDTSPGGGDVSHSQKCDYKWPGEAGLCGHRHPRR